MDVLTDTMSTTQMQSKTGRVDSYDAMVALGRKMDASDDFLAGYKTGKASQADVKAEDAIRRDASDDFYVGYRIGKASQARYITWKAFDYAKYKAEKASQAAVEAENDEEDAIDKLFRWKINSITARRDALHEFRKNHHV